jgi:hypothetical protein
MPRASQPLAHSASPGPTCYFGCTLFEPANDQTAEFLSLLSALPVLCELQLTCCAIHSGPWQRIRGALTAAVTLTALRCDLCAFECTAGQEPLLHSMPALRELRASRASPLADTGGTDQPRVDCDVLASAFVSSLTASLPNLPGLETLCLPQMIAGACMARSSTAHSQLLAALPRRTASLCGGPGVA